MFKGFNVDLTQWDYKNDVSDHELFLFSDIEKDIDRTIKSFTKLDGKLDGTKMIANWFPVFTADIFISHSHDDLEIAIALAAFLKREFNLKVFIDSCVWKQADILLKLIDNEYCRNTYDTNYNYKKRNYSTSHVHMMLSTALSSMIDLSECLFFLNTPQSVTPSKTILETESPWIYTEIAMSRLIRRKSKEEHRGLTKAFAAKSLNEDDQQFKINHEINLDHLVKIDTDDFITWYHLSKGENKSEALNRLYNFGNIAPQTY